jgi:YHS domain-containing protein
MKSGYVISRTLLGLSILVMLFSGCDLKNVAIKGYDPVAYFTTGKAVKGNPSISFQWHNATWYFSSLENSNLFAAAPAYYAPQYDGYCAWAMTEARKAHTDPEVWKIVNGKLYLNCSKAAYEKWSKDIWGNIKKADANWLKLSAKK